MHSPRRIGETGLTVSPLGFGTAPLGGLFEASSDDAAGCAIDAAIDGGITHFDTAPSYGFGLAEERLGTALKAKHALEITPVVSSKVGRILVDDTGETARQNWAEDSGRSARYDISRDGILRSVEDSLERTKLETLDILFLHDPDKQAEDDTTLTKILTEAYGAMDELRAQGMISAIGIGVNSASPCFHALEVGKWDCFMLAGSHSVLMQEDSGLLDECLKHKISVMIAAPFLSGVLAGGDHWRYKPVPEDIRARVSVLRDLCRQYGAAVEAAALQFPLFHPAVCNVVVGMRTASEVAQNLAALNSEIPADLWASLNAEGFISDSHFEYISSGAI